MIEQFLNRDFLLAVAEASRAGLQDASAERKARRRGRKPSGLDDFSAEELEAVAEELAAVPEQLARLEADSAAARAQAHPETEVEIEGPPKDDYAFIPRDRILSIVQSAVEEAVEEHQPHAIAEPRVVRGRRGGPEPAVTARRLKEVKPLRTSGKRRIWKRMEIAKGKWVWLSDPRWAYSKICESWRDVARGYADFIDDPPTVEIANNARVFVVGDWGSGLERAQKVARRMRDELARGARRQQIVIHLGDVYYSGTKREFERRFLKWWPVDRGSDMLSFTLPGNHDMYTGGHAYYATGLADPRFERQNGCSFFALRNDHWQLLGLDTAYEDAGLHGRQAAWARELIQEAPARLKSALLSHHQLFSAHESGAKTLQEKIAPVLEAGRIDAWFWGHEHRCIQYDATEWNGHRMGFSSCIGHGGIPEYLVMKEGETRPRPWAYEYLTQYGSGWQPWDMFGFAVLELNDKTMAVRYIDENGVTHHQVPDVANATS
jgi:3',5'-cyclic AMP phosphodiesterase CpdA